MINCTSCKKETNNPKFCCRSCSAKYTNKHFIKRKAKIVLCNKCNINRVLPQRLYCSSCSNHFVDYSKATFEQMGKKNATRSNRIRMLARLAYLRSDLPKCCYCCGYDKHFHICHIKQITSFDLKTLVTEINNKSNIVALCPNHHWELDHGKLKL